MTREGLTVGLIVKNEERFLPACLKSIRPIADEVIVVDTGSTDRTVGVAKRFGARVLRHAWQDNYSKARNVYVEAARYGWILSIDADETVAPRDLPVIRRCLKRARFSGWSLRRRAYTSTLGPFFGWRPARGEYAAEEKKAGQAGFLEMSAFRVFRRREGFGYDERRHVHEYPSVFDTPRSGRIGNCPAVIHDFGCLKGPRFTWYKQKLYASLNDREIGQRPMEPYELSNLAIHHAYIGRDRAKAMRFIRMALRKDPDDMTASFLEAALNREKGDRRSSIRRLRRSMKSHRNSADLLWLLGVCLEETGERRSARRCLERALKIVPGHPVYLNSLGVLHGIDGRKAEATKLLKQSLKAFPDFKPARQNLRSLCVPLKPLKVG